MLPVLALAGCAPNSANHGPSAPAKVVARPFTPAPAPGRLTSEPGGPVFELIPPGGPGPIAVVDWTGRVLGTLAQRNTIEPASVSADGLRMLWNDGVVTDPTGAVVGSVPSGDPLHDIFAVAWATDDRTLCGISPGPDAHESSKGLIGEADIEVVDTVTGATHRAGPVGRLDAMQATVGVVVCRPDADLAVIAVDQTSTATAAVDVVRLSTGAMTAHDAVASSTFPVVSPDGTLLAEPAVDYSGTAILSIPSGAIVGRVDGGRVVAFSGDGSRVVVESYGGAAHPGQTRVIDWRSNTVLADGLHAPLDGAVAGEAVATRPGGGELLMLVYRGSTIPTAVLVDADGVVTSIDAPALELLPGMRTV